MSAARAVPTTTAGPDKGQNRAAGQRICKAATKGDQSAADGCFQCLVQCGVDHPGEDQDEARRDCHRRCVKDAGGDEGLEDQAGQFAFFT